MFIYKIIDPFDELITFYSLQVDFSFKLLKLSGVIQVNQPLHCWLWLYAQPIYNCCLLCVKFVNLKFGTNYFLLFMTLRFEPIHTSKYSLSNTSSEIISSNSNRITTFQQRPIFKKSPFQLNSIFINETHCCQLIIV